MIIIAGTIDFADADVLVCPLHLYAYRWRDGTSSSGLRLQTYPVHDRDGDLVIEL